MSEIIDKGSWLFAAVLVLIVSTAFFLTINVKLQTIYRIPTINEFYDYSLEIDEPVTEESKRKFACHCGSANCRGTMLSL